MTKWESATSSMENIPIEMESLLKIAFGWYLDVCKPITRGWALWWGSFWGFQASFVLKWQHLGRKQNNSGVSSWITNYKAPEGSQRTRLMRRAANRNFLTWRLQQTVVSFLLWWMPSYETDKHFLEYYDVMSTERWGPEKTTGSLETEASPEGYIFVKSRGPWLCKWDCLNSVCCLLYRRMWKPPYTFLGSWED